MTCTGGRSLFPIGLGLSLLCSGCISRSARFIQSDQSFQAQPATSPPQVFIDRSPEAAFASVGIVEVRGPLTASKEDFVSTAVAKGTELGCDLLVHQYVFEMRSLTSNRSGRPIMYPNGVAEWLFACGVLNPAKPPQETAQQADAVAQEIVRSDYGDPCAIEAATGSHLRSVDCRPAGLYSMWNNGQLWLPQNR